MKNKKYFFDVGQTYSEITPESAEIGDFSDTGWEVETSRDWSISDILRAIKDQGIEDFQCHETSIAIYGWFYTSDYSTGTERQLCLHIDGSARNIKRLTKLIRGEK